MEWKYYYSYVYILDLLYLSLIKLFSKYYLPNKAIKLAA